MAPRFAELHAHSAYTFLDGASQPEDLVRAANQLGLEALAVLDVDGMYSAIQTTTAARQVGLPTVMGAELTVDFGQFVGLDSAGVGLIKGAEDPGIRLPILATSPAGYHSLCGVISDNALDHPGDRHPAFGLAALDAADHRDWLVMTGTSRGPLRRALASSGPAGASSGAGVGLGGVVEKPGQRRVPAARQLPDSTGQYDIQAAGQVLSQLVEVFGRDHLLVESTLTPTDPPELADVLAEVARRFHLPLVATTAARCATPADAALADVLLATRLNASLDRVQQHLPAFAHFLRSAEEMVHIHHRHPEAVDAAADIGQDAAFDMRLIAPHLPATEVPAGFTDDSWLKELTYRGAKERYGTRDEMPEAWEQIDHELDVITRLGFSGYFLIVKEIVDFCGQNNILCQGRGSAANSAVCFALGITAVDAVRHHMMFERFLSPGRSGPPDIDVDIEAGRRELVIQHVYARYGRQRAALVANTITYRPKSAIRDAARALGYAPGVAQSWSKGTARSWRTARDQHRDLTGDQHRDLTGAGSLPNRAGTAQNPAQERRNQNGEGARASSGERPQGQRRNQNGEGARASYISNDDKPAPEGIRGQAGTSRTQAGTIPDQVIQVARALQRLPRHMGIHPGGMVLTEEPVSRICPVGWAAMKDRTVLQWDKEDCADAGLVKFDLLGLGMLTALRQAFHWLGDQGVTGRNGKPLGLHNLTEEDPRIYDLLCAADTVGVFQVESRAQMATLPRLQPRCFYDIVVEVALIRPGPIQGHAVNPYLRRRAGKERVTYLHPLLKPALAKTLGVPLFQEQLMRIAIDAAGFSPAMADRLRRAMGAKRSRTRMESLKPDLFGGLADHGITGEMAEAVWEQLKGFADFGFPESHSFSFAHIVYASAWLKVHYPEHFYAGILSAQPMGFYSPATLIQDAKRHGVRVCAPDVSLSAQQTRVRPASPAECMTSPLATAPIPLDVHPNQVVQLGLETVKGLGQAAARVVNAREEGPFETLADVAERASLSASDIEHLAQADAFRSLGVSRREALWAAEALASGDGIQPYLPGTAVGAHAPALPALSAWEGVQQDYQSMAATTGDHPLAYVRGHLRARGIVAASDLDRIDGGRIVTVAGLVTHRQRPYTARGVTFVSLEDETGLMNISCSVGLWKHFRQVATTAQALIVRGMVERDRGAINIQAHHLEELPLALRVRSRDFR